MRARIILFVVIAVIIATLGLLTQRLRARAFTPPVTEKAEGLVAGIFRVRSSMSPDSHLELLELVAKARAQELDFIVLTDRHRQYAGPMLDDGVVVLSYAELMTREGVLIGLGAKDVLPKARREQRHAGAAIHELGGKPIVAHPFDRKHPFVGSWLEVSGLEIASFSSSIRRRGGPAFLGLLPTIVAGFLNPKLALLQLYEREAPALAAWDRHPDPTFAGFCGVGAHHAMLGFDSDPSPYVLVLDGPVPAKGLMRAQAILAKLKEGRFGCAAAPLGKPAALSLVAEHHDGAQTRVGETVSAAVIAQLAVKVEAARVSPHLVLLRNGVVVARASATTLSYPNPKPGTYRAELWLEIPDLLFGTHQATLAYSGRLRVAP